MVDALPAVRAVAIGEGAFVGSEYRIDVDGNLVLDEDGNPIIEGNGDDGTAIGVGASVTGEGGTAIGAGAEVTGTDGIAIGRGVTAGENQIRIGAGDQTDVRIGAYDIGTNTRNIATNLASINTNSAGIATNLASINTNRASIDTNRAGIATAVALASLPVINGARGGWSIAAGSFDSESAIAIGANFNVGQNATIRFGVSTSSGETSGAIGFGMGF